MKFSHVNMFTTYFSKKATYFKVNEGETEILLYMQNNRFNHA